MAQYIEGKNIMLTQFFTIGLLMLLAVMLPGPDFALVTKNALFHSRRAGFFTSIGIGISALIHMTYCALGLAIVISNSLLLFSVIKYLGAAYLIYLGVNALLSRQPDHFIPENKKIHQSTLSAVAAFRQGFLCNLLNPKATLFFLALFTTIIKPQTPHVWVIIYITEMFLIITSWFFTLTLILSHRRVTRLLEKAEQYIAKTLGFFLIGFGVALALVKKQ